MSSGLALTILTGVMWIGVGVVFSLAAKGQRCFISFMFVQSAVSTLAAWALIPDYDALLQGSHSRSWELAGVMALVALLGAGGFFAMKKAMQDGRHGAAWTISQSAMIVPFAASLLLWHEKAATLGWTGLALMLAGLPLCSSGKAGAGGKEPSKGWLPCVLLSFALLGASQAASMAPSHWDGWTDKANLRAPLLFLISSALWLAAAWACGRRLDFAQSWRGATLYALFALAGQLLLYKALDAMSAEGMSGVVYPLAIGICVGGFLLYSAVFLKERPTFFNLAGAACSIAGMAALAAK